jgi:hypothetical protein
MLPIQAASVGPNRNYGYAFNETGATPHYKHSTANPNTDTDDCRGGKPPCTCTDGPPGLQACCKGNVCSTKADDGTPTNHCCCK